MNPEDTLYCRAPLVLNLAGMGTDDLTYREEFGGRVLCAALRLYSYAILRNRTDGVIHLRNLTTGAEFMGQSGAVLPLEGPLASLLAAIRRMEVGRGFDLTVFTEAPPDSGLASDTATTVATLAVLAAFEGRFVEKDELAELCISVERDDLGKTEGLHAAYASVRGSITDLSLRGKEVVVNDTLIKDSVRLVFETNSILAYRPLPDSADGIATGSSPAGGADADELLQVQHRLKVLALSTRDAFSAGDHRQLGTLLNQCHDFHQTLHPSAKDPSLVEAIHMGREAGARGAVISDAGRGRCILFFCEETETRPFVQEVLQKIGCTLLSFHVDDGGARIWHQPQENS
jgi:D-glycero-alpha-D-manno-heptose-7-phosphate kinase